MLCSSQKTFWILTLIRSNFVKLLLIILPVTLTALVLTVKDFLLRALTWPVLTPCTAAIFAGDGMCIGSAGWHYSFFLLQATQPLRTATVSLSWLMQRQFSS
jgi:hypothetical protein